MGSRHSPQMGMQARGLFGLLAGALILGIIWGFIVRPAIAQLDGGRGPGESRRISNILTATLSAEIIDEEPGGGEPGGPGPGGGAGAGGGGGAGSDEVAEEEAPQPAAGATPISPGSAATVGTDDGLFEVTVPAGATRTAAILSVTPVAPGEQPAPGAGLIKIFDRMYQVLVEDAAGNPIRRFDRPLILTHRYNAADLPAGADPDDLLIFYWDQAFANWIALPSRVEDGRVTAFTDHLTIFALMAAPGLGVPRDLAGHWAEAPVLKLVSLGAVTGFEDGTFRPHLNVTRAQFTVMLSRAMGLRPVAEPDLDYTDAVPDWAAGYVAAAAARGLVTGYDDGTFRPDENITREQLAVMTARALGAGAPGSALTFADADQVSPWAVDGVSRAVAVGIVTGYEDNTFRPQGKATRAEAATMISRLVDRLAAGRE